MPMSSHRHSARRGVPAIAMALAVVGVSACSPASRDADSRRVFDTMPAATTIGAARHLAHWLEKDLAADTKISDADKADLRARAQILAAQAASLDDAAAAYERKDPGVSKRDLEHRTAALDEEYRVLMREWMVFQVRHGQRSASEVGEIEPVNPPGDAD